MDWACLRMGHGKEEEEEEEGEVTGKKYKSGTGN